MSSLTLALIASLVALATASSALAAEGMVTIPSGTYVPFVLSSTKGAAPAQFKKAPVSVPAFLIDRDLVTNEDFLHFVEQHPDWRKSRVKAIFADSHYLKHWRGDLELSSAEDKRRPVTNVSWFAATAFCESEGKELPTTDQWELAFQDNGRDQAKMKEKVLEWYSRPSGSALPKVGAGSSNHFGINDLSTLVWEWTLDFNNFLSGDEQRESGSQDRGLFCGGGSMGTLDSSDYVAFMRFSFRASLKASYTIGNLGFRCAKEIK